MASSTLNIAASPVPEGRNKSLSQLCKCTVDEAENFTVIKLVHYYVRAPPPDDDVKSLVQLLRILQFRQAIVFVHGAARSKDLCEFLQSEGMGATFIHEALPYRERLCRFMMFKERAGPETVLVASCCGHAMEFKYVDVAINFDGPGDVALYNHRFSSRRARKGLVVNFIRGNEDLQVLKHVEKTYNISITTTPDQIFASLYLEDEYEER